MAKSVNRTFLLGHVGKNPEVGTTPGGTLTVNFSLATTDREKDRQGNWSDRTEWHNLVAYGRTAEIVRDYVSKGTQLFIQGKIQTRSWDDKEYTFSDVERAIQREIVNRNYPARYELRQAEEKQATDLARLRQLESKYRTPVGERDQELQIPVPPVDQTPVTPIQGSLF